jgi:hypothetical protein
MLTPGLSSVRIAQRNVLLGRSIGRILAHELYHILADETGHANEGIAKSAFTAGDLLAARFEFERGTLQLLRNEPLMVADNARGDGTTAH